MQESERSRYSSLPTTPIKFPMPIVTYKLGLRLSVKIFNFNQFVNILYLNVFYLILKYYHVTGLTLTNKHIVMGDLLIINSNDLRKLFTKDPKFRGSKPINFDKA